VKLPEVAARLKRRFALCGLGPFPRLGMLNELLEVGRWVRRHRSAPRFATRGELHDHVNTALLGGGAVDYLEFGVFEGRSIARWAAANADPRSRFVGFDTFEGLPEGWRFLTRTLPPGTFSVGGRVPAVADARVAFRRGLFQETLPGFLRDFEPRSRLVVHLDADLYTSTLYVLASLDRLLVAGSVVILDEFSDVHEFRAFRDYAASFRRGVEVLGTAGPFCDHVALAFL
jgi:hypothetical protein